MRFVVNQNKPDEFMIIGNVDGENLQWLKDRFGESLVEAPSSETDDLPPSPRLALRLCREKADLTQKELASKLGISKQYVSDMECGRRSVSLKMAKALSCALHVPVEQFL